MKKHFFLLSLLISLTLGIGQMWGAEQTVSWSASAGALGTAISSEGGTATGTISTGTFSWNYTRTLATLKSGKSDYVAMSGSYMQLGSSNAGEDVEFRTSNIPGTIKSVTVLAGSKDSRHTGTITVGGTDYNAGAISAWANNAGADWTGTGTSSGEIVISISCNSKKSPIYIASITVVYEESGSTPTCATPTFTPAAGAVVSGTTVALASTTDGATIHYTTNGSEPTTSSATYSTPISITTATTIKAIAVKSGMNNSSVASASYTALTPLTTMDQIFAAATSAGSTATTTAITFNNWVVTGVKSSNAYVTDGTKGFIIYTSSHGFKVGDIISGTAICKVQLYNGSAELTELTASKVTVNTGGSVTPVVLDADGIAALSGVNTGSVIKISGECTSASSKYYIAGVQLYNTLYSFSVTAGTNYECTGVYLQYNSTKEILPRSAADIEEIAEEGAPETPTFSPTAGTYTSDQNVEISCATDGATIYYTTNGTTPTSSSTPYTTAISVGETMTIKAIAIKNDKSSSVATAEYIINNEEKTHTWNLAIDETATASDDELTWTATYVSMSFAKGTSTTNANNYYPGTSGKSYTSTRIYKNGVLTITPSGKQITKVEFMATSNDYATALKKSTWTNGVATIDNASPQYVVVTVSNPGAVSAAIGGTCGFTSVKVHYTAVDPSIPADPTFSPAAGTYTSVQSVEISCETEDATIYYTTDGTPPTSASTQYSSAISVSESMTIKAIAIKESKSSSVVSAAYTINIDSRKVAASPEGGFSSISGDLSGNEISFAAYQGGSATPPNGNNTDHELRLYKYQDTTNYGGYVTITAKEGCTIDQVVITVGGNCKVGYCKDAEDFPTKESTPISVGTSNPFDSGTGLNASSVNVISLDGSNQFKIKTIKVYYTGDAVAPPTPSEDEISDYVLVTDLAQLQAGDKVIIVASVADKAAGSAASTYRSVVDITRTPDKSHLIFGESMPTEFTLGITNEGKYTFHDGNGYMYEEEAKKVKNQADPASWTITIGEGNIATIQATNELRYNSGNPRFTTYASGQQSLQLYRKPGFEELRPNLEQGRLYSACMTQNIIGVQGGILWDISHYEGTKVYFEEIVVSPSAPLTAGRPFILMVTGDFKVSYSGDEISVLPAPSGNSALRGTFDDMDQDAFNTVSWENNDSPIYMLVNNQLRQVADYTGTGICTGNSLAANRAYLLYSALNEGQPNLAPGRRVMTMSVEENVATDINFSNGETINAAKIIRNGQILILRDGKTFDVTGRELR